MKLEKFEIDTREILVLIITIGCVLIALTISTAWTIGKIKETETLRLETIQLLGLNESNAKKRKKKGH